MIDFNLICVSGLALGLSLGSIAGIVHLIFDTFSFVAHGGE